MANLPTNRTVSNTPAEHVDDHNTLHAFHNLVDAKGDLIVGTAADTAGKLSVGTNGHILTADSTVAGGVKWAAPSGSSVWTQIHRTVVTVAAADVTISAIPGTYNSLRLMVVARSTQASDDESVLLRCNGDTGANYDWIRIESSAAANAANQTSAVLGVVPANNMAAGMAGSCSVEILEYARTNFHKLMSSVTLSKPTDAADIMRVGVYHAVWQSTAAITSLNVRLANGNLAVGSTVTLYGIT